MSNTNIDNNDNKNDKSNIDNIDNVSDKENKYTLKDSFIPRTDNTHAAFEIATELGDIKSYARHLKIVNILGPGQSFELLHLLKDMMRRTTINNPAGYYNRMAQNKIISKNGDGGKS